MNQLLGCDPIQRLGQNAGRRSADNPRTLHYVDFMPALRPAVPAACDWSLPITDWGTMGNDRYGNCVPVTAAHALLTWRANESQDTRRITDEAVIALSREMGALNGYNIVDRLNYWRNAGMWADRLWAYVALMPIDLLQLRESIYMFGCADIAIDLPRAWKGRDVWDTGTGPAYRENSWGPHSVPLVGYDAEGFTAVSWGRTYKLTARAAMSYIPEAYALLDSQWIAKDFVSPSGFDLPALHAALHARGVDDVRPIPTYSNAT